MNFTGKTALVTGSGSGIGKSIALMFAQAGANVAINDVSQKDADSTAQEIESLGREAISIFANVAVQEEVREMFESVKSTFGQIDILVNNAGITRDGFLMKMTEDQWDQVIDVNLKGVFNCCKFAARMMSERQYGKIINIASASAQMGNIEQSNYATSKGGVISMTKTLAKELAQFHINVNAVSPGFIETPMTEKVPEKVKEYLIQQIPLGRAGKPEDVGNVVCFLASDQAAYVTGQVISCSGGMYVLVYKDFMVTDLTTANLSQEIMTKAKAFGAGVSTGLVNDIPSVAELVSRIASDAEKIIQERISGLSRRIEPGVHERRSLRREGNTCHLSVF